MNVLFLTHNFPRSSGDAAGSFVLRLALALRAEDVHVHVVAPAAAGLPQQDEIEGIPVERFRYAPRRFEKLAYTGTMATDVASSWSARLALVGFLGADFLQAVRARRTVEPDVIHAHWWFPSGVVGTWLGGLSHVPLLTTMHGTDVRLARTVGVARPLFRHVIQHSAAVTTVSKWLGEEVQKLNSSAHPIVAPMPVATNLFAPKGEREKGRLLFVGRLNNQKGLEHLIHAFADMKNASALDVVGDGPARDTLQALAAELGVSGRIRWHGQLKQTELAAFYQKASALVVPSAKEGLGMVAIEALLCETPVVAFDSGGLRDIVQHDRTGVMVPPGDRKALASAVDGVFANEARARDLGKAGRLYALATFAPESAARKYADIYRQLAKGKPA
ncbi:MAG: glycosyltransferase [Gemmatimonadaceae bacterium]|nr:glycosyltransferase [Gemmatimonadaceae bacterium]